MQLPVGYPWQLGAGIIEAHRLSKSHSQQLQAFLPQSLEPLEERRRILFVLWSHFSTSSDVFCVFASILQLDFKLVEDGSLEC